MRLERLRARLEPADVAKLLRRGFALVLDRGGHLVARSGGVEPGAEVRVALAEGWLDARVIARDAGADPLPGRAGGPPSPGPEGRGGGEGTTGGDSGGGSVAPLPRRR
jgi:exodeoxyribonuclease VII large subunit